MPPDRRIAWSHWKKQASKDKMAGALRSANAWAPISWYLAGLGNIADYHLRHFRGPNSNRIGLAQAKPKYIDLATKSSEKVGR